MSIGSLGQSVRLEWRDATDTPPRKAPSTSSSSSSQPVAAAAAVAPAAEGFITHEVSRLDTLAGISLKYNVPPADIKRFNGILSDNAIYGRQTLLVPKNLLPAGEEIRLLFAQVATRIGRDPVIHVDHTMHPPLSRSSGVFTSMPFDSRLGGPPKDQPAPWWCQCGMCTAEDDVATTCRRLTHNSRAAGDVEMTEWAPSSSGAGYSHVHDEALRRRRPGPEEERGGMWRDDGGGEGAGGGVYQGSTRDGSFGGVGGGDEGATHRRHGGGGGGGNGGAAAAAGALLQSLGCVIAESGSAVMQRLKQGSATSSPRTGLGADDAARPLSTAAGLSFGGGATARGAQASARGGQTPSQGQKGRSGKVD